MTSPDPRLRRPPADVHVSLVGRSGLSEQIRAQLSHAIEFGGIEPGTAMPSSRELAARLAVSRNIVVAAYDRLLADGLVETRRSVGVFVAPVRPAIHAGPHRSDGPRPRSVWLSMVDPWDQSRERPTFDLRAGVPDTGQFPFRTWRRMVTEEPRAGAVGTEAYAEPAGDPALRSAVARHLTASRSVRVGAGTSSSPTGSNRRSTWSRG